MTKTKTISPPNNLEEINLKNKPKLTLSSNLLAQIYYTHILVSKNIEFCGLLVYEVLEGNKDDIENLKMEAFGFFPMDIGTSGSTEAKIQEILVDLYDAYPELLDPSGNFKFGLIHTHHNMESYFSITDKNELSDSTPFHHMYLSLIVNYAGNLTAKICVSSKVKEQITKTYTYKDKNDKLVQSEPKTVIKEEDIVEAYECSIFVKINNEKVANRLSNLLNSWTPAVYTHNKNNWNTNLTPYEKSLNTKNNSPHSIASIAAKLVSLNVEYRMGYISAVENVLKDTKSRKIEHQLYKEMFDSNYVKIIDTLTENLDLPKTITVIKSTTAFIKNNKYGKKKTDLLDFVVSKLKDYTELLEDSDIMLHDHDEYSDKEWPWN